MKLRPMRLLSACLAGGLLLFAANVGAAPAPHKTTTGKTTTKTSVARKKARRRAVRPVVFDPARPQTLRARAAVVVDSQTGDIVWAKNAEAEQPIASLSKLMTALVFLDDPRAMTDSVTITRNDVEGAGHSHVRVGNRVSVNDLLHCSLISSDNAATRALARSTGLSDADFAARMNARARTMGLSHTHYEEMTGLSAENRSTAMDQARVLLAASRNPIIADITSTPAYTFRCSRRVESLINSNRLLRSRSDVLGGKTGFIRAAGYCLATLVGQDEPNLITVVLGASTSSGRFTESSKLIEWAHRTVTREASAR